MGKTRRWVIKAGSQMVVGGGPLLLGAWMQQVARLRRKYAIEVVWVTSGAIGWATERTNFAARRRTLPQKQALSAIGQPLVMEQYILALQAAGLTGAQVLLTAGDLKDAERRRNLHGTLKQLLTWSVTPVLNENDAVATEEIQFGDNDQLASRVAVMLQAERLILLTDVDGLYDADPKRVKTARLIPHLPKIQPAHLRATKSGTSTLGTGGMYSKLLAAERATKAKVITHLIRGDVANGLLSVAAGVAVGTQIGGRRGP